MTRDIKKLKELSRLIRYWILLSTTEAGSGHLTSSFSAVEIMTALVFGGFFKFDLDDTEKRNNDHLIFSKGHGAPLLYSLYAAAGKIEEDELMKLRKFDSNLEGHPTSSFPYTEVATGSLGQGLSIGVGRALNGKYVDKLSYRTIVLLGDSEMSEGSVWEAIELAAHYKLDNLIGIIDVNRLGQRGETMYGHNIEEYEKRISSFGWDTVLINDGHSFKKIISAYKKAFKKNGKPTMIIAKTIKGKGISFLEDKNGFHGKALSGDDFKKAKNELGDVEKSIRGKIELPPDEKPANPPEPKKEIEKIDIFEKEKEGNLAPRKVYGRTLAKIFPDNKDLVVLDAEVSNSTYSKYFKETYPERFFEMYIAEQNMIGVAQGFSVCEKVPFVSTFAAFMTRAYDQIRMSEYSKANIKFIGSHGGVSIGEDGPSQMGLEDISLFRSIQNMTVLYPSDAESASKLIELSAKQNGNVYIRTTRMDLPIIYTSDEEFEIGKSKVLRETDKDSITLVGAGVTLHECLKAHDKLEKEGIYARVIDLYSIKPIDSEALKGALNKTKILLTVEDHYKEGGIGEAISTELVNEEGEVYSLFVDKKPKSGTPEELLDYEGISSSSIIKRVKELLREND